MELLEGQSLDKLDHRRSMPYPKLLDLGTQAADAPDAAHRKGILHRDIKPANISLSLQGRSRSWTSPWPKSKTDMRRRGQRRNSPWGTPIWQRTAHQPGSAVMAIIADMSPEQARGETLDARSDVFSWAW